MSSEPFASPDTHAAPAGPKLRFGDIATHLREAIRSGQLALGSTLPNELELCRRYGTSRHTVRAALQELQRLGLVSRRKNAGTRVESLTPTTGFEQSLASMDDLVQFGASHSRVVRQVGEVQADAALAPLLGCAPGSRWLRVASQRLQHGGANAEVIGWTEVYVPAGLDGLEDRIRQSPGTLVSTLLESHYGHTVGAIDQQLCAVPLPAEAAHQLGVAPGAPGLRVLRSYRNAQGQLLELSVTHHPAERFVVHSRLTRAGG